jgi:uncharacterized RDD family membrane protein YckC
MDDESTTGAPAGLIRRLAALFYDLLLAAALAFAATFAMLPLTHGEAILPSTQGGIGHAYHVAVLLVVFAYFGWSWTRSGQTLGLKAWRIRLQTKDGGRLGWAGAAARFALGAAIAWIAALGAWYLSRPDSALAHAAAVAMLGVAIVNFGWIPFDAAGRSLQDLACGTRVLRAA